MVRQTVIRTRPGQFVLALFGAAIVAGLSTSAASADLQAAPSVLYVIKGKVTQYIPASGPTIGSVSIIVSSSNRHGRSLRGTRLTFGIGPGTKLVVDPDGEISEGDRGIVKVRGPKLLTAGSLRARMALQVIARGNGAAGNGNGHEAAGGSTGRTSPTKPKP
jgi:hypothetical protein